MKLNILFKTLFFIAISCSVSFGQDISSGLVGYYPFNGNANDESTNNNNGEVNGALLTTNIYNQTDSAYVFNGTTDFIKIPHSTEQNLSSFSISVWVYPQSTPASSVEGQVILTKGDWSDPENSNYNIAINAELKVRCTFEYGAGSNAGTISKSALELNKWNHITFIYSQAEQQGTIHINSDYDHYFSQATIPGLNDSAIYIGKATGTGFSSVNYFNGKIDEVRLYDRAITQDEIDILYANYYAPDEFMVANNVNSVNLSWSAKHLSKIAKYRIFRDSLIYDSIVNPTDSVYIDNNVTKYESYKYHLSSVDKLGNESLNSDTIFVFVGDDLEPNNDTVSAIYTDTTASFTGTVTSGTDYLDYYCFKAEDYNLLKIKVTCNSTPDSTQGALGIIQIKDKYGTTIGNVNSSIIGHGQSDSISIITKANDPYYFNVMSLSTTTGDSISPYTIDFIATSDIASIDSTEINNTMNEAYLLNRDFITGHVGYKDDQSDWYEITFNGTGTFTITIDNPTDSIDIFNGLGGALIRTETNNVTNISGSLLGTGEPYTTTNPISVVDGSKYYIHIYANQYSAAYYTLKINSTVQYTSTTWAPTVPVAETFPNYSNDLLPGNNILKFNSSHPTNDPITYDLYIDNNNPPLTKVVLADGSKGEYIIPDVNWGDTLYWKAAAHTATNDTAWTIVNRISAMQFETISSSGLPAFNNGNIDWGDFDNDGDLDMVLTGSTTEVYRNTDGSFSAISAGLDNAANSTAKWGDYNGDGFLDIIVSGSVATNIYKNNKVGGFTKITTNLVATSQGDVDWGDYDNDGDLDILLTGSGISKIYRNEGSDKFVDAEIEILEGVTYSSSEFADLNNDGFSDIIIGGSKKSHIYLNDGSNNYTKTQAFNGIQYGAIACSDYDNDGDTDVLLTGYNSNNEYISEVYKNNSGIFTLAASLADSLYTSDASWGDIDNDGDQDILLCGLNRSSIAITRIYLNEGSDTFSAINNSFIVNVRNSDAAFADIDNDGDLDFSLMGLNVSTYYTRLYSTNTITPNNPPTAPSTLLFSENGSSVNLNWTAPSDDNTPSVGLSYDIYVKNNDSTNYQTAISSNLSNGKRNIAQKGLIASNSAKLLNVKRGSYSWGVQAIDASFAGSAFATGTFNKSNTAPVSSELNSPANNIVVETTSLYLKWNSSDVDGDSIFYTVKFGTPDNMLTKATDITADSILITDLEGNTNYNWQIIARDDYGGSSTSETYVFTTIGGENEPNNDLATATCTNESVSFDATVGNNIDPIDYYCFDATKNCILTVTVTNNNTVGTIGGGMKNIDITEGDKSIFTISSSYVSAGKTGSATFMAHKNKRYYIPIEPSSTVDYVPYRIDIIAEDFTPADNFEYNNTKDAAYNLSDSTISATVGYWGDNEDWYKIQFENYSGAGQTFDVSITNPSGLTNIQSGLATTQIYNAVSESAIATISRPGDGSTYSVQKINAGPNSVFYIKVAAYNELSAADYELKISSPVLFTKSTYNPTTPLAVSHPNNASNLVEGSNLLTWTCSHPTDAALTYDLYLSKDSEPTFKVGDLPIAEYSIEDVQWSDTLYWRVVAKTATNDSASSQTYIMSAHKYSHQWEHGFPHTLTSSNHWGDYDNDGDMDIIISGQTDNVWPDYTYETLKIFNNNNGSFYEIPLDAPHIRNGVVKWGDIDNDGDLDFVMSGFSYTDQAYYSGIYENVNNSFIKTQNPIVAIELGDAEWFDYDNDGDLDLIINGSTNGDYTGAVTKLYQNNNAVFTEIETNLKNLYIGSIDVGDYDNDGDLDLLLNGNDNTINNMHNIIYANNNGVFESARVLAPEINSGEAVWGDCDNDGDLDILVSAGAWLNDTYKAYTKVLINFNGAYIEEASVFDQLLGSTADWVDFNNDGYLDIVVSGRSGSENSNTYLYRNELHLQNGFVFENWMHGVYNGSIDIADFDNDNDVDFLISGENTDNFASTVLVQNGTIQKNTPPQFNGALHTKVDSSGLVLSWDRASDAQTPSKGLTYNVFIKGPNGMEFPTMADTVTGYRRIAAPGITNDTVFVLDTVGKPTGTYTCMVQAIDASYIGGPWSLKRTFTLSGNPAPELNLISPETNLIDVDTVGIQLIWSASDPDNEPLTYDLHFGSTFPPALYQEGLAENDTVFNLPELDNATMYYWYVKAYDGINTTTSETRKFETFKNNAPEVTLISPDSAAQNAPIIISLEWSVTDQENDIKASTLFFGRDSVPSYQVDVSDTNKVTIDSLAYETKYFWRVTAVDSANNLTESQVWSFVTSKDLKPNITLISPANGEANVVMTPVTLTWEGNDDGGANSVTYDLFFGTNNPPRNQRLSQSTETSFRLDTLCSFVDFYWQVRAYDKTGNDSLSAIHHFKSIKANNNFFRISVVDTDNQPLEGANYTITFDGENQSGTTDASGNSQSYFTNSLGADVTVSNLNHFGYINKVSITPNETTIHDVVLPTLGDYNKDGRLTISDLSRLISNWNSDINIYEMAPTTGTFPNLTVNPNGVFDFEDLMIFVMIWEEENKKKSAAPVVESSIDFDESDNDFMVTYTQNIDSKNNMVTYTYSISGNENLNANSLKIKYNNNQLTYIDHSLMLSEKYNDINIINRKDEYGYFELNSGLLNENYINSKTQLMSISFAINDNNFNAPTATYEAFSKANKESKGTVQLTGSDKQITIYPNPATTAITVNIGKSNGISKLKITDITGKILIEKELNSEIELIDISELPNGILMIQIEKDHSIVNSKIVKH